MKERLGWSEDYARRFINVFENLGHDKSAQLSGLSNRALFELAAPSTDDAVLDGRNRYTVARELGIEYPRCDYLGTDPLGFVISRNLARRHLSETQRAWVAAEIANMTAGDNQHSGPANLPDLLDEQPERAPVSQAEAEKLLNVSERSVRAAVSVRDHGVPELGAAVKAGEIAVSAAAEIAKQPAEEQVAIERCWGEQGADHSTRCGITPRDPNKSSNEAGQPDPHSKRAAHPGQEMSDLPGPLR